MTNLPSSSSSNTPSRGSRTRSHVSDNPYIDNIGVLQQQEALEPGHGNGLCLSLQLLGFLSTTEFLNAIGTSLGMIMAEITGTRALVVAQISTSVWRKWSLSPSLVRTFIQIKIDANVKLHDRVGHLTRSSRSSICDSRRICKDSLQECLKPLRFSKISFMLHWFACHARRLFFFQSTQQPGRTSSQVIQNNAGREWPSKLRDTPKMKLAWL